MAGETVGKIPAFSGEEEVKETTDEKPVVEEKETPTEPPAELKPAETEEKPQGDGTGEAPEHLQELSSKELANAVAGLQHEWVKLNKDIQDLRGTRRDLKDEKEKELIKVSDKIDELKDLHPEDITLIDRVLKAKGYVTKDEAKQFNYETVKQQRLTEFLNKYPEYKPENDLGDKNWSSLQKELGFYRMPNDAQQITEVLERAHKTITGSGVTSDRGIAVKKRQTEIAGVGAGGTQLSPSKKSLSPRYREELERGGWSEEDIKSIEQKLE